MLIDDDGLADDAKELVLAACEGPDQLDAAVSGEAAGRLPDARRRADEPIPEPLGAYLRSLTVEGFRGIGSAVTLHLQPGPGLTLVVGRNGSGKSSFAEALELLLTGDSWRWKGRSQIWG